MANFLYHLLIVGVFILIWSGGFMICRQCSMYFDDAKCKGAFTIQTVNLRKILIASTYLNYNKKRYFRVQVNKRKYQYLVF